MGLDDAGCGVGFLDIRLWFVLVGLALAAVGTGCKTVVEPLFAVNWQVRVVAGSQRFFLV